MSKKGLTISIEYSDRYCQACYYSERHERAESVTTGAEVMRYLMPSALCYDPETREWTIGNSAVIMSAKEGTEYITDFMTNIRAGVTRFVDGREYTYKQLLSVYYRKLLEFIQVTTSVMNIDMITLAMRYPGSDVKQVIEEVFGLLDISSDKIRLLSFAESYGYFVANEAEELWEKGTLLFDFGADGFFVKKLELISNGNTPMIRIDELDLSEDFSLSQLENDALRDRMDRKLLDIYRELTTGREISSVYFTGEGFEEQWFGGTLTGIGGSVRAFKGNNIYAKGACIAGYLIDRHEPDRYMMICPGRTKKDISVEACDNGKTVDMILSYASTDWYDAGYTGDFILEDEHSIVFRIDSVMNENAAAFEVDLSSFPPRPEKTTRIQVDIAYLNDHECDISITDKGFGEFFPDGGSVITKRINLESYY